MITVDIWDSNEGAIKPIEVPVLLASDVLHQIWNKNNPKLWATCIGATAEKQKHSGHHSVVILPAHGFIRCSGPLAMQ